MTTPIEDGYEPSPPDKLTRLTAAGDVAGVRAYFDEAFWAGRRERPTWDQVRTALLREDKPMLRLLVNWNAMQPTDDDMVRLSATDREKYPAYVRALRAAGMTPAKTPWEQLRQVKLMSQKSPPAQPQSVTTQPQSVTAQSQSVTAQPQQAAANAEAKPQKPPSPARGFRGGGYKIN